MTAVAHLPKAAAPLLLFSFISNLAILVNPLFMMQVLDRVVPSGNVATLLLLASLAAGALILQGVVDWGRDLALQRLSRWEERAGSVAAVALAHRIGTQDLVERVVRFARFMSGQQALTALSLPWLPLFFVVLWLIHPAFAILVAGLLSLLVTARLLARLFSQTATQQAEQLAQEATATLQQATGFAARLGVAGIEDNLRIRFLRLQAHRHRLQQGTDAILVAQTSVTATLRSLGQISALGIGAYLVTQNTLSAGGMIAASLIVSKTYGALEGAVTHWNNLRMAWADFQELRQSGPEKQTAGAEIAELAGALRAEALIVPRGGGAPPLLDRVSLSLAPGECLAIVGGSGAGKTTLLQALAALSPAPIGSVFFDESEVRGLSRDALYKLTGYLPQRAELAPGSLAENIACFEEEVESAKVIEAAKAAGVHGLISALPQAYASDLSKEPWLLSAGQVQRVAMARALYNQPRYLFLDEPNALLDGEGERALGRILMRLKAQGTTIVIVLHRSGLMGLCDQILRLETGRVADYGPRSEVLSRISGGGRQTRLPLRETSLHDLRDWIASQFSRSTDEAFSQKAQLVTMELFRILIANGDSTHPREALVTFTFVNDNEVELSLRDNSASGLEDKMLNLRTRLEAGQTAPHDLNGEERALVAVTEMTDRIEVQCGDEATVCLFSLSNGILQDVSDRRPN